MLIAKGQEYWTYIVKLRPKFELKTNYVVTLKVLTNASKKSGGAVGYTASIPDINGTVPTLLLL